MRWMAIYGSIMLAGACGGDTVGRHVPRPNPNHVAGVAAAAAAALTVADPGATRNPEKPDAPERRPVAVDESVPVDVLDRADRGAPAENDDEPCPQPTSTGVELLPGAVDASDRNARGRCRPDAPAPRRD